jgi:hypothetical protein
MILEQIQQGLITGGIWAIIGLPMLYFGRFRLLNAFVPAIRAILTQYVVELLQDVAEHPEKVQPVIDSLMKSVLGRPGGMLPKEATVKLPILGRVPAAWFEPLIKNAINKFGKVGADEAVEAVKHPFG